MLATHAWGQSHGSFILKLNDSSIKVSAPAKKIKMFTVVIENNSLSHQIAKIVSGTDSIKYLRIDSGKSQTVEIENKGDNPVYFVPLSPAFQEIELKFGKKSYEIPPQR